MRIQKMLVISAVVVFLAPTLALGQVDEESFQQIEFNFIPPGARSTAMGGAFIGLADDATAANSNPAGLLALLRPEISFEYKLYNMEVERLTARESLRNRTPQVFEETVSSPAFASLVLPGKNWAVGIFRHEYIRFENRYRLGEREIPDTDFVFFEAQGNINIKGEQYGLSLALRTGPIDWGVGVKLLRLSVDNFIRRTLPGFLFPFVANEVRLDDSATKVGATFGVIIHLSPQIQIGGVAHLNPTFDLENERLEILRADGQRLRFREKTSSIAIPHQFGGGIAIRPADTFVITADVVWLGLSRMFENSTLIYEFPERITANRFSMENRVEFHAGAEFVLFLGDTPLALRGGFFVIPEKRLRYNPIPNPQTEEEIAFNRGLDILYNGLPEESNFGVSGGLGIVIQQHVQIDVAFSTMKSLDQFSASAVIRF